VGLVTLAFPDCIYDTVTLRLTENTFMPLPSHNGELSKECITELLNEVNNFDVVVFGCGLGRSSDIKEILGELILKSRKPLIIDADGLNALVEIKEALKSAECDILLTPHPGEMSRLIKRNVDYIEKNREKVVNEFCKEYNVNVLLKGNNTIISDSSATSVCINKTGNTGLSKGGSGDLLSGMIAGFTPSLKGDLFKAASLGAYIHGKTSEMVSEELTEFSTLPTDCSRTIGKVIKSIIESE
jgi:NAD(P)H-hydrate epimerase